jgi:hypothetical protein
MVCPRSCAAKLKPWAALTRAVARVSFVCRYTLSGFISWDHKIVVHYLHDRRSICRSASARSLPA